jgi:hypothetical protein
VSFATYRQVWVEDFEYSVKAGELPSPICLVAHELHSGRTVRRWLWGAGAPEPYKIDDETLVVGFFTPAEVSCRLVLGWQVPTQVVDLYPEFRARFNGQNPASGWSLLSAAESFGVEGITAVEKSEMRELAIRGGPFSRREQADLLDYCESDVSLTVEVLRRMAPGIDLPRALLRGRYMTAVARMENVGVPIDADRLMVLRDRLDDVKPALIEEVDRSYGVFAGTTFKQDRFGAYLTRRRIAWPRTDKGSLMMENRTWRTMATSHPELMPLRELRASLSQLRLHDLAVGPDGRNRTMLSPFSARTSRNQPSNNRFVFGPAVWIRSLIKPAPGMGLAYVDWSQQEFGIAAALSQDPAMMEAYTSGDPYLAFAVQAGAAPSDATKETHGAVRERFKQCALAVQYGMGECSMAKRLACSPADAQHLLDLHRQTYPRFWQWSDAAVDVATLRGRIETVFGWPLRVGPDPNPRSLRNFPVQANGAEMLRIACILITEAGIRVCAPVHDALLIEAPLDRLDADVVRTQQLMEQASVGVLDGFRLRTDVEVIRYPDRYQDPRGTEMWNRIWKVIGTP